MLGAPWAGDTAFILGGGPSLTSEIAERVRGRKTLVINSTARLAPWANVLFFSDYSWFKNNRSLVDRFGGVVMTNSIRAKRRNLRLVLVRTRYESLSAGHHAVDLAMDLGAKRIVLLGFDCRFVDGRSHNHSDYRRTNERLYSDLFLPAWSEYPERARQRDVVILNATPGSAIDVFPRISLEKILASGRIG